MTPRRRGRAPRWSPATVLSLLWGVGALGVAAGYLATGRPIDRLAVVLILGLLCFAAFFAGNARVNAMLERLLTRAIDRVPAPSAPCAPVPTPPAAPTRNNDAEADGA